MKTEQKRGSSVESGELLFRALDRAVAVLSAIPRERPLETILELKDLAESSVLASTTESGVTARARRALRDTVLAPQDAYNESLLALLRRQACAQDAARFRRAAKLQRLLYVAPFDGLSVNGGTARIFGIARALSSEYDIDVLTVVGPNRAPEVIPYAPGINLYCAPLSAEYVQRTAKDAKRFGNAAPPLGLARHLATLTVLRYWFRSLAREASLCILNQPYLVDLWMQDRASTRLVYDVPEVNSFFTQRLAGDAPDRDGVRSLQARLERDTCAHAFVVGMCSQSDAAALEKEQGAALAGKLQLIPNGVWVDESTFMPPSEARELQQCCEYDRPLAVFMGIPSYPPNVKAVQFIAQQVAPHHSGATFAIIGMDAAGGGLDSYPPNVVFCGRLSEARKDALLAMADFCLAPIAGYDSGSSLKVADYIAHGKPVLATTAGRRGYEMLGDLLPELPLETISEQVGALLLELDADRVALDARARSSRELLRAHYDWRMIAAGYARRFEKAQV